MASEKAPVLDVQKDDALDAPVHELASAQADRGVSQTSSGRISGVSAPRSGGVQMKADPVMGDWWGDLGGIWASTGGASGIAAKGVDYLTKGAHADVLKPLARGAQVAQGAGNVIKGVHDAANTPMSQNPMNDMDDVLHSGLTMGAGLGQLVENPLLGVFMTAYNHTSTALEKTVDPYLNREKTISAEEADSAGDAWYMQPAHAVNNWLDNDEYATPDGKGTYHHEEVKDDYTPKWYNPLTW